MMRLIKALACNNNSRNRFAMMILQTKNTGVTRLNKKGFGLLRVSRSV
jgi:hypothetical protein